jgi:membrane peptidoglycan carboxypeptidase
LKRRSLVFIALAAVSALVVLVLAAAELLTSNLQARNISRYAREMTFAVKTGKSDAVTFPDAGPFDLRVGYAQLPGFIERLESQGFRITVQARQSDRMRQAARLGFFLPYREKTQTGMRVLDCQGQEVYAFRYPQRVYGRFEDIPPVIVKTLLYIENRELLSERYPRRNPAVEWDRLTLAVLEKVTSIFYPSGNVPGGSTLATQIEKYRHSPEGITQGMKEKLRQMISASLRAYQEGEETMPVRRRIVLDYLNTVPLAAAPRHGEVHGLGDGLRAWYDLDFDAVNRALLRGSSAEAGRAFKHVLALLISQRKPSWYLISERKALDAHSNAYLTLLENDGIIPPAWREVGERTPLSFGGGGLENGRQFVSSKATNAIRTRTAARLGLSLYDLDRLDLTVSSTLNAGVQNAVTDFLQRLADPEYARAAGIFGTYLLSPENDLTRPIYSLTVYERMPEGFFLRVQADNLNQPFDVNAGAKLDLGSTAKLRTLVNYLQIVARLHGEFSAWDRAALTRQARDARDPLAQWVAARLLGGARGLAATLEAAMNRRYSANPNQTFVTGGGEHRFVNFNAKDDLKEMDLWEATRNSVNLVYIRLMRDIVRHYITRTPGATARILEDASNPARKTYLLRFVEQESRVFLWRFYNKYRGKSREKMAEDLLAAVRPVPYRLAAVHRWIFPDATEEAFGAFMQNRIPRLKDAPRELERLYASYARDRYGLADRGYLGGIHPLELWVVDHLFAHPRASFEEVVRHSRNERIAVYDWLFRTGRKNAQDRRIQSLLEVEAFEGILKDWKTLGYPFDSLVPSLATAIGSSADRPAALAELMGIVVNDGVRLPMTGIRKLHFAAGTPYETVFELVPPKPERLLPTEVAQTVRKALAQVVEQGTAARLRGAYLDNIGKPLPVGGKTGTGDHRYERYGPGGRLLESRVVNRAATLVFYLGDAYFGVISILVPGQEAENFSFTSSFPVHLIKVLKPALRTLMGQEAEEMAFSMATPQSPAPEEKRTPEPSPVQAPEPATEETPEPAVEEAPEPVPEQALPPEPAPPLIPDYEYQ